jgi:hypothetical protein
MNDKHSELSKKNKRRGAKEETPVSDRPMYVLKRETGGA